MVKCSNCSSEFAVVRRSATGLFNCKQCFVESFENDIYDYISRENLISDGDQICIGVSGGKDSSVLTHVLYTIKNRYNLNWNLHMLAIDEGIKGYRDDSLRVVDHLYEKYKIDLKVLNFEDAYGVTMDQVVELIGKRGNCTICGSFRRQILEVGARLVTANVLCTGHNADDMAETVLLNLFRGDLYRLTTSIKGDCPDSMPKEDTEIDIGSNIMDGTSGVCNGTTNGLGGSRPNGTSNDKNSSPNTYKIKRIKPLLYTFEKEIVLYARFLSLKYFSTECIYSPEAYRGHMRSFIKNLEIINPKIILNIISSGNQFFSDYAPMDNSGNTCIKCGIPNVKNICKPCVIVQELNVLKSSKSQDRNGQNVFTGGTIEPNNESINLDHTGLGVLVDKKLDSHISCNSNHDRSPCKAKSHNKFVKIKYENIK